MLKCTYDLTGISPLGFSKPIASTKATGEGHDAFEDRTWRERLHVNDDGHVFIPPMAMKNCMTDVAQYLSEKVPGKRQATFTKHFKAGVMVSDPMVVCNGNGEPVEGGTVEGLKLFVPSDGKRGGGSRVWKTFPIIKTWSTSATLYALDPVLIDKPDKIEEYLGHAGQFVGMLFFRPANNGYFGRFKVSNFKHGKV